MSNKVANTAFTVSVSGVITLFHNGTQYTVDTTHSKYNKILDKVKNRDFKGIEDLISVAKSINKAGKGKVVYSDGTVTYNGEELNNYAVTALLELDKQGLPIEPLINFLDLLMKNPSKVSVDNLYRFLEKNGHPLLECGSFVAYKKVRNDFTDCHTGKFDNSPGKTVEMPRNLVEDNPSVECASGLHVAALSYAKDFSNGRLVVCAVAPEDVVSVPYGYESMKMRVSKYIVLEEYKGTPLTQADCCKAVTVEEDDFEEDDDDLDDDGYDYTFTASPAPKRDKCGRFCRK